MDAISNFERKALRKPPYTSDRSSPSYHLWEIGRFPKGKLRKVDMASKGNPTLFMKLAQQPEEEERLSSDSEAAGAGAGHSGQIVKGGRSREEEEEEEEEQSARFDNLFGLKTYLPSLRGRNQVAPALEPLHSNVFSPPLGFPRLASFEEDPTHSSPSSPED